MKPTTIFSWLSIAILAISCSKDKDSTTTEEKPINESIAINSTFTNGPVEGIQSTGENPDDIIANSTFSSTVKITYGTTVTVDNPLASKGVTITINKNDVTINATVAEVAYEISGTTTDGSLKIYSDKKFKLTLNKVSIKNNDGPALNIQSGKRAFIVVNETNTLEDGSTYATSVEDQKGAVFSEGQIIFSGQGSLSITANNKHAIASDDYIRFISGNFNVLKAKTDAIHSKDGIYIDGGTFNIKADSDGIEAEKGEIIINNGDLTINVVDDGITASWEEDQSIDPLIIINGGKINITCAKGEGIESKSTLTINNGTIYIKAYDDAINAEKAIYINNGTIVAHSTTNDGVDSNGTLTITGGRVMAIGAKSPETGFDCDNNTFKITGGWIVGLGGSTSTPTASVSTQASTILGLGQANTIYSLINEKNEELITFNSPVSFSTLLVSNHKITVGSTFNITTAKSVLTPTDFNGIYTAGKLQDINRITTFTQSSLVSKLGGNSGSGGGPR